MSDAGDLWADIERYEGYIDELNDYYDRLKALRDNIHNDHYKPDKDYDMTRGDKFLGARKDGAEHLQGKIAKATEATIGDINHFLEQIDNAIANLKERISDCWDKINGPETDNDQSE